MFSPIIYKSPPGLISQTMHSRTFTTLPPGPMTHQHTNAFTLALPPEIWRMVLHRFGSRDEDIVELWMCRGVSKYFKYEVEQFFIAKYLPHTSMWFDITSCQSFNRNSRIEFYDHHVRTIYSRISVDRAAAFFKAKHESGATLLQLMHNGAGCSAPSHWVDFRRPLNTVALPGVFFHANGDVEVGWRELFAAVLAEEKYRHQAVWNPVSLNWVSFDLPEAFIK